jgi:hypothetical protein
MTGLVHVQLTGSEGILIDERRPLREWLASSSREYNTWFWCSGSTDAWSERPGTAWGCIFKPASGSRYRLRLEVVEPVTDPQLAKAVVFLEGGPRDFLP